ncbi:Prolyl oligopeptidase family protein [bacterium A37T11]|nr:Prolyl oligopeptidase family protein [bacterium A37T11]
MFPTVEKTPNLAFTRDLKHYKELTSLYPEEQYNWITSELHTYKGGDINTYQGVLYKPENFDPKKKYPVIFNFYQSLSNTLHEHITPQPVGAGLNIPYLVSNGYLVFCPDIHIGQGRFGEDLLISIEAAADHLSTFDWVDASKLALSGHSYGGFEVNYLVTRTDRFACALSGAGISSIANNIFDLGHRNEEVRSFAKPSSRMGAEFEDNPQLYIKNSLIFFTKEVNTPVLFVHSEDDRNVPFYHSMQFFKLKNISFSNLVIQRCGQ